MYTCICFFFSSRRRHTKSKRDWSSDVCSSDLYWVTLWCGSDGLFDVCGLAESEDRDDLVLAPFHRGVGDQVGDASRWFPGTIHRLGCGHDRFVWWRPAVAEVRGSDGCAGGDDGERIDE